MDYENKTEHKVVALNDVNDADTYIIVTEANVTIGGRPSDVIGILAAAIAGNDRFRMVVLESSALALKYRNEAS